MGKPAQRFVGDAFPDGIPNNKKGSGILALPRAIARLGWVAGPILLTFFYFVTVITTWMLADVYEVNGIENGRYHLAVRRILGPAHGLACAICQLLSLFLTTLAYTISGASALKRIVQLACEYKGIEADSCWDSTWKLTLLFGTSEIPFVLLANLEESWYVSALGVASTLVYTIIALGLGIAYADNREGSVGGTNDVTSATKAFQVLGSIGSLAFAYAAHAITLEICDSIRQPPKAAKVMKKAINISVTVIFVAYSLVAYLGYASLGNDVPGFLFNGFPDAPRWVLVLANVAILLHMYGAYAIYSHPVFNSLEHGLVLALARYGGPRGAAWASARGLEAGERAPDSATVEGARAEGKEGSPEGSTTEEADAPSRNVPTEGVALETGPRTTPSVYVLNKIESEGVVEYTAEKPGGPDGSGTGTAASPLEPGSLPGSGTLGRRSSAFRHGLERLSESVPKYHLDTGLEGELHGKTSTVSRVNIPFLLRLPLRTLYVIVTTVVACCLPFFGDFTSLVGAITFWPFGLLWPIHCWRKVYRPSRRVDAALWALEIFMGLVAIGAIIGSVRNIAIDAKNYTVFGN